MLVLDKLWQNACNNKELIIGFLRSVNAEPKPFHASMVADTDLFSNCALVSKQEIYQIMIEKGAQGYFVEWTEAVQKGNV